MESIIKYASSPEWWISVVLVGIIINLASSLLSTIIQQQFGHLVKKWDDRNQNLAKKRSTRISTLSNSNHELYLAKLDLNRRRLDNIFDWVIAVALLGFGAAAKDASLIAYSASTIFAMLSAMQGLISQIRYWKEALLIQEATLQAMSNNINKFDNHQP